MNCLPGLDHARRMEIRANSKILNLKQIKVTVQNIDKLTERQRDRKRKPMKNYAIKYIILFLVLVDCDNKIDELSSKVTELHAQSVEIIQKQIPVLTLKEGNPVLIMKINAGKTNAKVKEINIDLTGTSDLKDLENIKIFYRFKKNKICIFLIGISRNKISSFRKILK